MSTAGRGEARAPALPTLPDPPSLPRAHGWRRIVVNAGRRRRDPTRTARLQLTFERELVRRFRSLAAAIYRQIVEFNGFGLDRPPVEGLNANRGAFDFPRDSEKVAAFKRWLREAENRGILETSEGVPIEAAANTAWTNTYIETAYQKGIADAGAKLRAGGVRVGESWVRNAFNRPIHADRVGLIYTRTYRDLKNITDRMDAKISRVLAQGLAEGRNPLEIARALRDRVEKIGITRARLLARTEVIAAHAEASLNSYAEAGAVGVDVEAEWSTANDDKVCELCEELEGRVFSIEEARNMLPRHPNCRCAWRPKVVGGGREGLVLMWRRPDARADQRQRTHHLHAQRFGRPAGAVRRPHAHGSACRVHRGGRS